MQNEGRNAVCTLCLKLCECIFVDVEACTKEMLGILGLELDLKDNEKPIICTICSDNLQKCFDFKTVCMHTEGCIDSFRKDINNAKLDLTDVYLRKNGNKNMAVSKHRTICRLCMEIAESDCCVSIDGETYDVMSAMKILGTWFSELDLEITMNPVICTSCNESLHCSFSFLKSCLGMEDEIEKYCENEGNGNKLPVESNSKLPFEAESTSNCFNGYTNVDVPENCSDLNDAIKLEFENLMQEGSQKLHIKHEVDEREEINDVKVEKCSDIVENEKEQNGGTIVKYENLVKTESYGFNIKREEVDIKTEEGDTTGIQDDSFKRHMMIHENTALVTMYSCGLCSYKTKRKDDLEHHMCMLSHKNSSDGTVSSCEIRTYKAKQLYSPKWHKVIHKGASQLTTYSCGICKYKTVWRGHFNRHMMIHENTSLITKYSCGRCSYTIKRNADFMQHICMLIHKNSSDVTVYSCVMCTYKTKQLYSLKRHMLTHKDAPEVTTYSCGVCPYKTKWTGHFNRHILIHNNASKVTL